MSLDPITALIDVGSKVLDKFVPDPLQKAQAQLELIKASQTLDLAQLDVNKVEAASSSVFVAGWRPFIGWVCGAAFAFNFIGVGAANALLTMTGHANIVIHAMDMTDMMPVLFGMLGLGGLRTTEKIKGVAS